MATADNVNISEQEFDKLGLDDQLKIIFSEQEYPNVGQLLGMIMTPTVTKVLKELYDTSMVRKMEYENKSDAHDKLEKENEGLQLELNDAKDKIQQLKLEYKNKSTAHDKLEKENEVLQLELNNAKDKIERLKEQISRFDHDDARSHDADELVFPETSSEHDDHEGSDTTYDPENQDSDDLSSDTDSIKSFDSDNEISDAEKIKALKTKIIHLYHQLQEYKRHFKREKEMTESVLKDYKDRVGPLLHQVNKLKAQNTELKSKVVDIDTLNNKNMELQANNQILRKDLGVKISKIKAQNTALQATQDKLKATKTDIQKEKDEKKQIQQENDNLSVKLQQIEEHKNEAVTMLTKMLEWSDEIEEKMKKFSKWNEAWQKDVMETNEINERWSVAMMSFIDEFHHENKEIEEFIERINNIRGVRTDNHIDTSQTNPFLVHS